MTQITTKSGYWILASLLFLLSVEAAAEEFPIQEPHQSLPPTLEDRSWEELSIKIPAYPKDADLLEIQVDHPGSSFQYFIDKATLTVGKDGVVNYTLVARSNRGSKNVAFERMRCSNMEYKAVAYGTSKEEFRPVRKQRWRSIKESSNTRYRLDLWEFYLCDTDTRRSRSVKQIIDAIRYFREDRKDKGFL